MKTLKFRKHLVSLIQANKKNTTWRLFDDKDLSVGDNIRFIVSETEEEFAQVKVIFVKETTLDMLTDEDWDGHERFESDDEMYKTYEEYYNCSINKNSSVKIIKFELL